MNELKADSIIHSFENRKILSDIFLTLKTGEILGILGRNGCGKSTLLKIIFGALKADHKVIKINNQFHEKLYHEKKISYLPQHNFLPKDLTVRKTVSIFLENKANIENVLNIQILDALRQERVGTLSGGELRFLEIVLILNLDRPFILLDEPFSGLSPLYQEYIHSLLIEAKKDKGIIVTDHDYRNIIDISDRLLLIKNGKSIYIENKEELTDLSYLPKANND